MVQEVILNADDLGFSPGVNQAILQAHREGFLTHASLMANTSYFEEAVSEIVPKCPRLRIGVHLNLTCGQALYAPNCLAEKGVLRNNFLKILFTPKTKKVRRTLEQELEQQILKIKARGITISHLDGHEHIHIIPSVNKIARRLAKKYGIPRIREINENLVTSARFNLRTSGLANVIKLLLLKFLSIFNEKQGNIAFYSILNTCELNADNLFAYLQQTDAKTVEVMVHPGQPQLDDGISGLDERFTTFLKSDFRLQEFELCFNEKFRPYVQTV